MADLEQKIQSLLDLTDTEAAIYMAALSYPSVGVSEIVKLTNVKRTTAYHALDSLMSKGLMAKKGTGTRMVFSTLSPHTIEQAFEQQKASIEKQEKQLKELLPELAMLQKGPLFSTQVQHFQGIAGVKAVHEELLYCKSRHWDSISPTTSFLSQYGEDFHAYMNKKRIQRGITSRVLWEQAKVNKQRSPYAKLKKRDVRLMPENMQGRFKSKIIIFDNKIALITPAKDAGAVLITSEELHAAFQALFETIWEVSKPVKI